MRWLNCEKDRFIHNVRITITFRRRISHNESATTAKRFSEFTTWLSRKFGSRINSSYTFVNDDTRYIFKTLDVLRLKYQPIVAEHLLKEIQSQVHWLPRKLSKSDIVVNGYECGHQLRCTKNNKTTQYSWFKIGGTNRNGDAFFEPHRLTGPARYAIASHKMIDEEFRIDGMEVPAFGNIKTERDICEYIKCYPEDGPYVISTLIRDGALVVSEEFAENLKMIDDE